MDLKATYKVMLCSLCFGFFSLGHIFRAEHLLGACFVPEKNTNDDNFLLFDIIRIVIVI